MIRFCIVILFLGQLAGAQVFDFETGDLSAWSLKRLPDPSEAKIVRSPVRAGKFAAQVGLAPGVLYKNEDWKNELSDKFLAPFHQEMWYRVSHYLPEDFHVPSDNSCVLAQWHNAAYDGWSPLLAHDYEKEILWVTIAYGTVPVPKSYDDVKVHLFLKIPAVRGQWHDLVYRVKWPHGGEGYIEAWHNGKYMGIYRGPIGYKSDEAGPYFKTGVYCVKTPQKTIRAYVDEYRRGFKKEDVLLPGEVLEPAK